MPIIPYIIGKGPCDWGSFMQLWSWIKKTVFWWRVMCLFSWMAFAFDLLKAQKLLHGTFQPSKWCTNVAPHFGLRGNHILTAKFSEVQQISRWSPVESGHPQVIDPVIDPESPTRHNGYRRSRQPRSEVAWWASGHSSRVKLVFTWYYIYVLYYIYMIISYIYMIILYIYDCYIIYIWLYVYYYYIYNYYIHTSQYVCIHNYRHVDCKCCRLVPGLIAATYERRSHCRKWCPPGTVWGLKAEIRLSHGLGLMGFNEML